MTRTKVSRKAANKKNRRSSQDPQKMKENKLRDLESYASSFATDLELKYMQSIDATFEMVHKVKNRIPKHILAMTIGDIMELNAKTLGETSILIDKNLNLTNASSLQSMSIIQEMTCRKESKDDEESEPSDLLGALQSQTKRLGPLQSAKSKRRSKSACGYMTTPAPKLRTPMVTSNHSAAQSDRKSRSKYRTPMNRTKAASSDRTYGDITPKVNPYMPLAILRHAKIGESIFSVTGSPVITSNICEETANVNIPVMNGILSIRPTEMKNVDASVINRIDPTTMKELKQLQMNLNMIVRLANLKMKN